MPAMTLLGLKGPSNVANDFAPHGIDAKGVTTFLRGGSSPVADRKLTVSVSRANKLKTLMKLQIPVVQDVDVGGVVKPTVVRTIYVSAEMVSDPTSTLAERTEAMTLLLSAFNTDHAPSFMPTFLKAEPYY